jgi:hypothetical protein
VTSGAARCRQKLECFLLWLQLYFSEGRLV